MINQQQISTLKAELQQQKTQFEISADTESFLDKDNYATEFSELSMYDNHPGDLGTALFERGKDLALSEHAQNEKEKVEHALQAIEKGTYGKCEVCGVDIPYERLEAIPSTTVCKEHSPEKLIARERPIEEEVLIPPTTNSYAERHYGSVQHYEDSFEEVAKYGTSETPSDLVGDYDDYNELYKDESKDGTQEAYENFSVTDISGNERTTLTTDEQVEYVNRLDEYGMESPLGDIPYKKGDSYLDDDDEKTEE